MTTKVSIIIRTFNEERYLEELLSAIVQQKSDVFEIDTVIVDSGSTDKTLEIAEQFNCRITHINKEDFSFGRSLNIGCEFATGDILAFISGHCIPVNDSWLHHLCDPIQRGEVHYAYGCQIGRETTKFSERQVFAKFYPNESRIPQEGHFCNNANAALSRETWQKLKFDESLTGLEDLHLAQRLIAEGYKIGYVGATATVYHIHNERWSQVMHRYEREAIALQNISPNIHISLLDFVRFFFNGVLLDSRLAISEKVFFSEVGGILVFRFCQYWGSYRGNHTHRVLSAKEKERYFYPT